MLKIKLLNKMPEQVNGKFQNKEVTPSEEIQEITPDENFDGLKKVIVNKIPDEYVKLDDYFAENIEVSSISKGWTSVVKKFRSPLIVTSAKAEGMFADYPFKKLPELTNTSIITDATDMFSNCVNATEMPYIDTSNATKMFGFYSQCKKIKNVPLIDTSKAIDMRHFFRDCNYLEEIPQINMIKAQRVDSMFENCEQLAKIPKLNWESVIETTTRTYSYFLFNGCEKLKELGGFQNLGMNYDASKSANYNAYAMPLVNGYNGSLSSLTVESIENVINELYDIKSKGCNAQQLIVGKKNISKLSSEIIAIANEKGWTVS